MRKSVSQPSPRRHIAKINALGITQIHLRNPYVIAWWSAAFPGMGHLLIHKYLRGFLLFIWEVIVNINSGINVSIFYSFLGKFEMAKQAIHIDWLLLYAPTYMFAIWDSYRSTVDLNKIYILSAREDAPIPPFCIGTTDINYLDKKNPWVSVAWSLLTPGLGQLYVHQIYNAFFGLAWWIAVVQFAHLLPAIHYSLLGQFDQAKNVLNVQWLMNLPSLYGFAIFDAYKNASEGNKLFEWEQAKYLKTNYQQAGQSMLSTQTTRGENVRIIASFEHSNYLELAITSIEKLGIKKRNILAIPLDTKDDNIKLFDSIHHTDGYSLFDMPAVLGTVLMLLGAVYGFVLKLGPIWWGLIGLFSGFVLGLVIKVVQARKHNLHRQYGKKSTEVVVVIECSKEQQAMIQTLLWHNHALAIGKFGT